MSQKNVELIIGRLATDEEFRGLFQRDPAKTVLELVDHGIELTRCERSALVTLDAGFFERFAESLDPRLQKVCLRNRVPERSSS